MKKGLDTLYGVLSVSVNQKAHRVGVDYDTTVVTEQQIEDYLKDRDYTVTNVYDLKVEQKRQMPKQAFVFFML